MTAPCYHSGLPPEECDFLCPHCAASYRPCPDVAGIRAACAAIRKTWPACRVAKAEGKSEVEIPVATLIRREGRRD